MKDLGYVHQKMASSTSSLVAMDRYEIVVVEGGVLMEVFF